MWRKSFLVWWKSFSSRFLLSLFIRDKCRIFFPFLLFNHQSFVRSRLQSLSFLYSQSKPHSFPHRIPRGYEPRFSALNSRFASQGYLYFPCLESQVQRSEPSTLCRKTITAFLVRNPLRPTMSEVSKSLNIPQIEKLRGATNYHTWRSIPTIFLDIMGVWDVVTCHKSD